MARKLDKSEQLARKLDVSVYLHAHGKEYEVRLAAFSPPYRGTYDDPPEDGEAFPSAIVYYQYGENGELEDFTTYESFLMEFATYRRSTLQEAERYVEDKLHEYAHLAWSDYISDSDY